MLRKYHEGHIQKNQGDLNLAVQTKPIGNLFHSIFNEQKQENLFLDNLVKTVPIP